MRGGFGVVQGAVRIRQRDLQTARQFAKTVACARPGKRIAANSKVSWVGRWKEILAARRKEKSNAALWAKTASTSGPTKASSSGMIRSSVGAFATSASRMPVSWVIRSGMARSGLTNETKRSNTRQPKSPALRSKVNRTAPISMIASTRASSPVVSRSRATKMRFGIPIHSRGHSIRCSHRIIPMGRMIGEWQLCPG